jgi:hypothetical protein
MPLHTFVDILCLYISTLMNSSKVPILNGCLGLGFWV